MDDHSNSRINREFFIIFKYEFFNINMGLVSNIFLKQKLTWRTGYKSMMVRKYKTLIKQHSDVKMHIH